MSVDLFFPENRDRATRLTELISDTSSMQRDIRIDSDNLDAQDERIRPYLNQVMEANGITTIDELVEKSIEALPAEEAQAIRDMLNEMKDTNIALEQALGVFSILALTGTGLIGTAKGIKLIRSGALVASSRLVVRGIAMLAIGNTVLAGRLFRAAGNTAKTLQNSFDLTRLGKVTKAVKTAGKVLGVVGFFGDAIVVTIAAVEGKKQKEELQKAIKESFTKRVEVSFITELGAAGISFNGNMEAILTIENQIAENPALEDALRPTIDLLIDNLVNAIEDKYDAISYESAAAKWTDEDNTRRSYTDDDPSLQEAITKLEEEEDVAFD